MGLSQLGLWICSFTQINRVSNNDNINQFGLFNLQIFLLVSLLAHQETQFIVILSLFTGSITYWICALKMYPASFVNIVPLITYFQNVANNLS